MRRSTACRNFRQFRDRYNLANAPIALRAWNQYCKDRNKHAKIKSKYARKANVSIASLMSPGLVPVKRSTQRHTMQLRGRATPTSAGLPTLGKRR